MNRLIQPMLPELILATMACALFLLGISVRAAARRLAPVIAFLTLLLVFWMQSQNEVMTHVLADPFQTIRVFEFANYIKLIAAGVGMLLVLLAWPSNQQATGNPALDYGPDAGEFFGLMLLSIAGVFLAAGANDIILLFLALELASIPTYIMVSISRPLAVAQEAGVKYFFLGAMSAAIMLFGFSYLYGSTGTTSLTELRQLFAASVQNEAANVTPWQQLALLMLIAGFAFKIAAVPLHFYAGDVYQGAATPLTAFLSFVPKTAGFVALIKLIEVAGGGAWAAPISIQKLLWVLAVLTMSVGNVLGLLQVNVKRVLAYSSIAHSGYILVGLTVMSSTSAAYETRHGALHAILFYLAAYGIMNAAAFGVLILLPARRSLENVPHAPTANSAETFEDIAGRGRDHPALGLAMAISCFSLIGLPLTVGFFGKFYLIRPALQSGMIWLAVITLINAAVSAAYYLRIVATMFLRTEPAELPIERPDVAVPQMPAARPSLMPVQLAVALSAAATVLFGAVIPATQILSTRADQAAQIEPSSVRTPELEAASAHP